MLGLLGAGEADAEENGSDIECVDDDSATQVNDD